MTINVQLSVQLSVQIWGTDHWPPSLLLPSILLAIPLHTDSPRPPFPAKWTLAPTMKNHHYQTSTAGDGAPFQELKVFPNSLPCDHGQRLHRSSFLLCQN
jgi:hypothetical protein